jgi:hypothetical protein
MLTIITIAIGSCSAGFVLAVLLTMAKPSEYLAHIYKMEVKLTELDKENDRLHHKLNIGLQKRGIDGRYISKKG